MAESEIKQVGPDALEPYQSIPISFRMEHIFCVLRLARSGIFAQSVVMRVGGASLELAR
jgi:hypothetical protein